jgi:hypothetical protein
MRRAEAAEAEPAAPALWRALVFVEDDAGEVAAIRWAAITLILAAAAVLAALVA